MKINFEILSENVRYELVQKLIQKISEEHNRHDLHITVKLSGVYPSESELINPTCTEQDLDERIGKIVNEEIGRRWQGVLKATYPPELWQALQSKFPDILSDSHE